MLLGAPFEHHEARLRHYSSRGTACRNGSSARVLGCRAMPSKGSRTRLGSAALCANFWQTSASASSANRSEPTGLETGSHGNGGDPGLPKVNRLV